jgi:hypothetical protein
VFDLRDEERDDRGEAVDVGDGDPGAFEGTADGGTFLLAGRVAEGDGAVTAEFVGGYAVGVLGDVGADADGAQCRGQLGEDGDAGADQQDAAPGIGRGAVQQGAERRPVLGAAEAERADAVVAVALQIGVFVGLPGEVPPDEVLAVALDDGGDGSAGEVLALGAAVDDVAAAGQRGRALQEQAADLRGEDRRWDVGGERGDRVEVGELEQQRASVDDEVHEVPVDLVTTVVEDSPGPHGGCQAEGRVLGTHAVSIPTLRVI